MPVLYHYIDLAFLDVLSMRAASLPFRNLVFPTVRIPIGSALLHFAQCELIQVRYLIIALVKYHGDFFDGMVPGLRIHEIREDQVEQQNGNIHSVTAQSKLP
jgi:hypothetical protein